VRGSEMRRSRRLARLQSYELNALHSAGAREGSVDCIARHEHALERRRIRLKGCEPRIKFENDLQME
jgi:hypothetical protein